MRIRAGVLVALIVAGVVAVISPAAPAWACSCVYGPEKAEQMLADQVVSGTVTKVTDDGITLAVDEVHRGAAKAGDQVRLSVQRNEASCGYDFRSGVRYRVPSRAGTTGLCNGVREDPAATPVPGTTVPSAPVPGAPVPGAPVPGAQAVVAEASRAAEAPARSWALAAGAAGMAVLALAAAAVFLRRRRG